MLFINCVIVYLTPISKKIKKTCSHVKNIKSIHSWLLQYIMRVHSHRSSYHKSKTLIQNILHFFGHSHPGIPILFVLDLCPNPLCDPPTGESHDENDANNGKQNCKEITAGWRRRHLVKYLRETFCWSDLWTIQQNGFFKNINHMAIVANQSVIYRINFVAQRFHHKCISLFPS